MESLSSNLEQVLKQMSEHTKNREATLSTTYQHRVTQGLLKEGSSGNYLCKLA